MAGYRRSCGGNRARAAFLGSLLLAAAGCGGDGVLETLGPPQPPPSEAPTLTEIQTTIFNRRCAIPGCHASPDPVFGLDLTEGASHASLVGVPSVEPPGFLRVEPGDPEDSYLYMKVLGDPRIAGDRMPPILSFLDADEIDRIRRWIEAGAEDN